MVQTLSSKFRRISWDSNFVGRNANHKTQLPIEIRYVILKHLPYKKCSCIEVPPCEDIFFVESFGFYGGPCRLLWILGICPTFKCLCMLSHNSQPTSSFRKLMISINCCHVLVVIIDLCSQCGTIVILLCLIYILSYRNPMKPQIACFARVIVMLFNLPGTQRLSRCLSPSSNLHQLWDLVPGRGKIGFVCSQVKFGPCELVSVCPPSLRLLPYLCT